MAPGMASYGAGKVVVWRRVVVVVTEIGVKRTPGKSMTPGMESYGAEKGAGKAC